LNFSQGEELAAKLSEPKGDLIIGVVELVGPEVKMLPRLNSLFTMNATGYYLFSVDTRLPRFWLAKEPSE
jgi:hypothetical protein